MIFNKIKFSLLSFVALIPMAWMLNSCVYDRFDLEESIAGSDSDGYTGKRDVITFTMTLDIMGGTRADEMHPRALELEEIENFVDPNKTRVLFFDSDDKFLFESKSRWVKRLDDASEHSVWSVYVPMYTYGNDKEADYNWNWEGIREKLTTGTFKVAILANRPAYQYYPDLNDSALGEYWYDNSGPKWTYKNSVVYTGTRIPGDDATVVKDIFDLHHTQYDPIYFNKSRETNGGGNAYDFIMDGGWAEGEAKLSATASWLDFSQNDTHRDVYGWDLRYQRYPSKEDPIPMYGVQEFQPLTDWDEGTSIELSRNGDKPISLLRSVVKIEVLLPKDFADELVAFYGNWFSRCEPMDVWTPTDQIWVGDEMHGNGAAGGWQEGWCEWKHIWDRGPVAVYENGNSSTVEEYKKTIMWQYGLWRKEKGWSFDKTIGTPLDGQPARLANLDSYFDGSLNNRTDFPRIFNTCIQRLQRVIIDKTYTDGNFDHYVIYCGERNINDPTNLTNKANTGSGNSPTMYFVIVRGVIQDLNPSLAADKAIIDDNASHGVTVSKKFISGKTYSFPMVDFEHGASVYNCTRIGALTEYAPNNKSYNIMGTYNGVNRDNESATTKDTGMGEYMRRVTGNNVTDASKCRPGDSPYNAYTGMDIPVPLLRNHVYKMTVTNNTNISTRGDDDDIYSGISIRSEFKASPTIGFENPDR